MKKLMKKSTKKSVGKAAAKSGRESVMKSHPLAACLLAFMAVAGILVCCALVFPAPVQAREELPITATEKIGPLSIAMSSAAVKKALGEPESATKAIFEGATGYYVKNWNYPGKGITLKIAAECPKGEGSVDAITIVAPSTLTTSKKVGIGSTYQQVTEAYPKSQWDASMSNKNRIVVGTIYDGLIIEFKDGKVTKMFLGAAAE